jgi:uncharacterized membrane protein YkvA (DUF1232 family)
MERLYTQKHPAPMQHHIFILTILGYIVIHLPIYQDVLSHG